MGRKKIVETTPAADAAPAPAPAPVAVDETAAENKSPAKRGRPAKTKAEPAPAAAAAAPAAGEEKKTPGKRGRPAKTADAAAAPAAAPAASAAASKKKKDNAKSEKKDDDVVMEEKDDEEEEKKDDAEAKKTPGKRGRPAKTGGEGASSASAASASAATPKKAAGKRGRPAKTADAAAADDKEEGGAAAAAAEKTTGKRKKVEPKSKKGAASASSAAAAAAAPEAKKEESEEEDEEEEEDEDEEERLDLWKQVFLCGTEWESLEAVHSVPWTFTHLDKALTEGEFANLGDNERLYLFGGTEPQMVEYKKKSRVTPIPVISVIRASCPVPAMLGLKSVQMEEESVVPMEKFKMGWVPLVIPQSTKSEDDGAAKKRSRKSKTPSVFALQCSQRGAALKQLGEEKLHRFDYCMPYITFPDKIAEEEIDTVVSIIVPVPGRTNPLVFDFDWSVEKAVDCADEKMEDEEGLPDDFRDTLVTAIRDAARAAKTARTTELDAKKARANALPAEEKQALRTLQKHKFYPDNTKPDIKDLKSRFINRYYGQATKVW